MPNANDVEIEQPITSGATDQPDAPQSSTSTSMPMPPLPAGYEPIAKDSGQGMPMPPLPKGYVPFSSPESHAPSIQRPQVDMKEMDTVGTGTDVANAFGTGAAGTLAAAGRVGSHIPGLEYVGEKLGDILGLPKTQGDPYKTAQASVEKNAQEQSGTIAGNTGHFLEGTAEFIAGEGALKGLSLGERMMEVAKITKILEKYPELAKAANQAKQIKALMVAGKFARASATAGAIGTVQGAAHTAPGEELEGAKAGAIGGAAGGFVGEGLGQVGGAAASALRKPVGEAVTAAGEAAGEDVAPGILRPGIETVAGQDIPVRSTSPVAQTAENLLTNSAKSRLQEFETGKTQPAVRRAVSAVAADAANIENAASAATKEDPLGFGGTRDALQERSKPTFAAIDEHTDGEFSKAQKEADLARQSMDFEGKKAYHAALDKQEKLFDYARWKSVNEAGADPDAEALSEDALAKAKADWKKSVGMDDLKTRFDKFVHPSPSKLLKPGEVDPGYVNPKQFREGITDAIQQGEFKKAGFTPDHIQALEDLGRILDKSQVKFNDTFSNLIKQITHGGVGSAIGFMSGGGIPGAVAGAVGENIVGRVLSRIMTNSASVKALTEGLESEASASGVASKLIELWEDQSGQMTVPGTGRKSSLASRTGRVIAGLSDDVLAAGGKKTKGDGELTAHGTGGASVEELSRGEKFLRVTPSGLKEYQGVSPDPQSALRPNEAIIAVKPDGTWRYQDGNPQTAKDVAERAIGAWKGTAKAEGKNPIAKGADAFNKENGREPVTHAKTLPSARASEIADAYDEMQHNPESPAVKKSYNAFKKDVKSQWDYATQKMGVEFEPWKDEGQPYANSKQMMEDVKNNKHLYYFEGGSLPEDHPMSSVDKTTGVTYNNMFRAVHDLFGHSAGENQFGPTGEERAWMAHRQMFSKEAVPALTTETRGQNSWTNFGKHLRDANGEIPKKGEAGYVSPENRPFAENKAGILPDFAHEPSTTEAENVLSHMKSGKDFAVFTAENPQNTRISDAENKKLNDRMLAELKDRGYKPVEVVGNNKDVAGNVEHSFFVPGITPQDAEVIGRQYKQSAILTNKGIHDLDKGTLVPSTGILEGADARKQSYYSSVGGHDFSTSLDFDKEAPESVRVGQRKPTASGAQQGYNPNLTVGLDAVMQAAKEKPVYLQKLAERVSNYPTMKFTPEGTEESFNPEELATLDPHKTVNSFVKQAADNIEWMHNQTPEYIRKAARNWYDTANKMTKAQAEAIGVSHPQAAGVTAVLSPQNPWDNNISLAKRVMDVWKNKQNFKWSKEMNHKAAELYGQSDAIAKYTDMVRGKTYAQLKNADPDVELAMKAMWTRIYDEAHNPRTFDRFSPTGETRGLARNGNGTPSASQWFSLNPIAKAISILDDGSMKNINEMLGNNHKVRNFYNNIVDPNATMGDTTVDTHAVGVAHLSPLGLDSPEVVDNFKSPANASQGLRGTYPLYAEAYKVAAKRLGILPRELQSITWEGIRSLFKDKSPELQSAVRDIWKEHQDGEITIGEARKRVLKAAGGFKPTEWESDFSSNEVPQPANDTSAVPRTKLPEKESQGNSRGRSRPAPAVSNPETYRLVMRRK